MNFDQHPTARKKGVQAPRKRRPRGRGVGPAPLPVRVQEARAAEPACVVAVVAGDAVGPVAIDAKAPAVGRAPGRRPERGAAHRSERTPARLALDTHEETIVGGARSSPEADDLATRGRGRSPSGSCGCGPSRSPRCWPQGTFVRREQLPASDSCWKGIVTGSHVDDAERKSREGARKLAAIPETSTVRVITRRSGPISSCRLPPSLLLPPKRRTPPALVTLLGARHAPGLAWCVSVHHLAASPEHPAAPCAPAVLDHQRQPPLASRAARLPRRQLRRLPRRLRLALTFPLPETHLLSPRYPRCRRA